MAHALPDDTPTIYRLTFWADAIERSIGAAAASAVSVLTVGGIAPDLITAPWLAAGAAAGGVAILELLRSLAAAGRGNPGTASFIRATKAGATPQFVARFTAGRGQ